MVRTQIQIPDALYRRLKTYAKTREWTLAETLRRGAEILLDTSPRNPTEAGTWMPPKPRNLGCRSLNNDELKHLAQDDIPHL